ncbi:MAG TPA: hypothetical protein VFG46_29150 [Chryseolinea sp.]|nr:hypothetical protein [Chryseolinea sp.]
MKLSITLILTLVAVVVCTAQPVKTMIPFNKGSIGLSVGHYSFDPGIMASVTTPFFLNNKFALRIAGGIRWSEYYLAETNKSAYYSSMQAGVLYFITQEDRVRVYSELGFNIVFPNAVFSDKKKMTGVQGLVGLDFFTYSRENFGLVYFVEMGYSVNPATAEKLEGQPNYANGLMAVTGFRFHL